jgi:hypothetical protein
MKKIILLYVIVSLNVTIGYSQKNDEIKVNSVSGIGYDDCISSAREKALNNAKIYALSKAGIEENINSYADLFKSETEDNYSELFTSQVFTNIRGSVKDITIISEIKSITPENLIKYEVEMKCTVIKYNSLPDQFYKADISGIKPFYYEGEKLSWTVNVTKDSWFYVFCIPQNQDDAYSLFPNQYEPSFLLKAQTDYSFPQHIELEQFLDGDKQQTDRIIMVLTKSNYPYTEKISYKNICDWIFSISPDQRIVESFAVSIVPKD